MKLLLDENLSHRIIPFIQGVYPLSTQVSLVRLTRVSDKAIRQYAINNDFVITTQDADFYDMDLIYGQPPKIIWLRIGNLSKPLIIQKLVSNVARITQVLITEDKACVEIF